MTERKYPKIEKFEDIVAWQEARILTKSIYTITQTGKFSSNKGLCNQIQRAAVSVMSNIAEGFERGNPGDYMRFLAIAKGSCGEVRCQLYVAFDLGYITQTEFDQFVNQSTRISQLIAGLSRSVARNRKI